MWYTAFDFGKRPSFPGTNCAWFVLSKAGVNMPDENRQSDSFVVRIWWERADEDHVFWRGWIQHAVTADACYFHRVVDMLSFIEAHTGLLTPSQDGALREGGYMN